jgi:hypothetical protein
MTDHQIVSRDAWIDEQANACAKGGVSCVPYASGLRPGWFRAERPRAGLLRWFCGDERAATACAIQSRSKLTLMDSASFR